MDTAHLRRAACAIVMAVIAWAMTALLLLQLPASFAVATMFVGLILFLIGARLNLIWPAAIGGVLMFSGVFAAALLGEIGA